MQTEQPIKRGRGRPRLDHHLADEPEYAIYRGARKRCEQPNRKEFKYYGGRGIEFRFDSYQEFIAAVGRRPSPELKLERIDNNGHYEKGNLCWTTQSEQLKNRRRWKVSNSNS